MVKLELTVSLPSWVSDFMASQPESFPDPESRLRLAIQLARMNVEYTSGGPFGAVIADTASGRVLAVGVNRVVPSHFSGAHAEMLAFGLAQQTLSDFDLGRRDRTLYELATSSEPCGQCMGAVPWSGVRSVVISVPSSDVERITGFDEGVKDPEWRNSFAKRGIAVTEGLLLEEGREVLDLYASSGGVIYNGRND